MLVNYVLFVNCYKVGKLDICNYTLVENVTMTTTKVATWSPPPIEAPFCS